MRMISLLILGAFWLVACDRPTEPKASSPPGGEAAQPRMLAQANGHPITARDPQAAAEPTQQPGVPSAPGADHANEISPLHEPTPQEEQTAMPLPGQATGEL